MQNPLISVIMGCYNDSKYIREAIDSILYQTVSNFEFIIIDDNSTDDTVEIIESYDDKRIKLIRNTENKGLGYNLHIGVSESRGQYIARMDADDISYPFRFEKQISFLEKNPKVVCVGTCARLFGNISLKTRLLSRNIKQFLSLEEIRSGLLLGTPMFHPSVMFSSKLLIEGNYNYDPSFRRAQDFELWSRMAFGKFEMRNINDILLRYRSSSNQASKVGRQEQIEYSKIPYQRILENALKREITDEELLVHTVFATSFNVKKTDVNKFNEWLTLLLGNLKSNDAFDYNAAQKLFARRWCALCRSSFPLRERFKIFNTIKCLTSSIGVNIVKLYL